MQEIAKELREFLNKDNTKKQKVGVMGKMDMCQQTAQDVRVKEKQNVVTVVKISISIMTVQSFGMKRNKSMNSEVEN